ncbi:MAG TPA: bifunctional hydroxymethylpyrimidine kinase/phosphomethylpyrimidine kinase [Lachnospiraceae bacterium]|nr:bifunctional hydroxymethylpyrimidine kinase/phosphomethylpyrimidine kinase [Lachnospiraceae bacterium]
MIDSTNRVKKMALISDLTGYGRCSLAVALPVVSVLGIQACPIPTAIFSNHLAYPFWHKDDYTPHIQDYLSCWDKLHFSFDGILCGFLGNGKQADIHAVYIEKQKKDHQSLFILDPVMGDHGKLYSSVTLDYSSAIKTLLPYADILTPNLTEACFLTDTPFPDKMPNLSFLASMTEKLHALGPAKIVVTGLYENGYYHNYIWQAGREPVICTTKAGGPSRPGTGDLFASIIAADALNQIPFSDSVKKAAEFVRICTEDSAACDIPINEGVCFERNLKYLIQTG